MKIITKPFCPRSETCHECGEQGHLIEIGKKSYDPDEGWIILCSACLAIATTKLEVADVTTTT